MRLQRNVMKMLRQMAGVLFLILPLVLLAACNSGGGDDPPPPSDTVSITGEVSDGLQQPVPDASCSFVDDGGQALDADDCDRNGIYQLNVPPDETGSIYCGPKQMSSLNLSTIVSTEGVAAGETLDSENVTPTTTVTADIIRFENPPDVKARKSELLLQAQTDPNLKLVTAMAGRLFRAMLAQNVNTRFGDERSSGDGDGGGDGGGGDRGDAGGVGGDAGDGADFSPLPEARCTFVAGKDLASAKQFYPAALADLLDGVLDRPDLAGLADDIMGETTESAEEIRQAFETIFPADLWEELSDLTDEEGEYFLTIPPNLEGFVRCEPKDLPQLALATYVPGRSPGQVIDDQDVNPATTVFSTHIVPFLTSDLATVQENYLADIDGLQTRVVFQDGEITGFRVDTDTLPSDKDVGLVAFSATALFNTFYKNDLDVNFLNALNDLLADQVFDDQSLSSLGVPADQIPRLGTMFNTSLDDGATALGTNLAAAVAKARINVTVMGGGDDAGLIPGATITVADGDVTCEQGCGQETNAAGQLTLNLSGVSASPATDITVEVTGVEGYAPYTANTAVVAFATVDLDIVLPVASDTLTVQGDGDGGGSVTSSPGGIDCGINGEAGEACSAAFASGTQITLTAVPAAGAAFAGWSGGCTGTGTTCSVDMDGDVAVTAEFVQACADTDYAITQTDRNVDPTAQERFFDVTATGSCPWTATPSQSWVEILDDTGVGTGNGRVRYQVRENTTGSTRTAVFTLNGNGATHTVVQAGDASSPTVTLIAPAQNPLTTDNATLSLSVQAADNIGVTAVSWRDGQNSGNLSYEAPNWVASGISLSMGRSEIIITAVDPSGNRGTTTLTVIRRDQVSPVVTIITPGTNPYTTGSSELTLVVQASDNIGLAGVTWRAGDNDGDFAYNDPNWTASGIPLSLGRNEVTVTAVDTAGNRATDTLTVIREDQVSPVVTIIEPETNPLRTGDDTVYLTIEVTDNVGVESVRWRSDQGVNGNATWDGAWYSGAIALSMGRNEITVTAVDTAGNEGTATMTVIREDRVSPTVTIIRPPNTTEEDTVFLTILAADDIGISDVSWETDRGASGGTVWDQPYWYSEGIPLSIGENIITVTATDTAGNEGTATLTVTRPLTASLAGSWFATSNLGDTQVETIESRGTNQFYIVPTNPSAGYKIYCGLYEVRGAELVMIEPYNQNYTGFVWEIRSENELYLTNSYAAGSTLERLIILPPPILRPF